MRSQIPKEAVAKFTNAGYRVVGTHSAVSVCHWTKESLRRGRVCYKERWYKIESHRCLELTPSVRKRSEKLGEYGKLTVNLLSNEDVILFKGITERVDDVNDIAAIVRSSNIAWDTVLQECTDQSGKRAWFGLLLNKIEELKLQGIDIPIERKLIALDKRRLLQEAYQLRLKKMTAKQAAEKLRELGFTNKELADAGIKG